MSDVPMSPEERAACYASLRYAIVRIDMVVDHETGLAYFDDLLTEDEETGDWRAVVPDDDMKHRFQVALTHQFELFLSEACPRATVTVTRGDKYSLTFAREGPPIFFSNDELWAAVEAYDEEWATDLCARAYDSLLADQKATRRIIRQSHRKRRLSHRRRM